MTRMTRMLLVGLAGLTVTACVSASHETARLDAAHTLAIQHGPDISTVEAGTGAAASAWGDRWTANNLLARAAEDQPTVINRFNLAVAYEKTGRFNDAAPIYRQLETDGRYTWAVTMVDSRDRGAWDRRFNVARESARRLAAMTPAVSALAPGAEAGAQAANAYTTPVGDPNNPTGIPNDRAEQLDAAEQ
jgi:hypothetical protein